jgi:hypothetical protein
VAILCVFVGCRLPLVSSHSLFWHGKATWLSREQQSARLSSRGGAASLVQPKTDDIEPTPLAQSLYLPELLNVAIKRTDKVSFAF